MRASEKGKSVGVVALSVRFDPYGKAQVEYCVRSHPGLLRLTAPLRLTVIELQA